MLYPVDGSNEALVAYGRGATGEPGDVSAAQLAAAIAALKGTATSAADTLGEIEALLALKAALAGPQTFTGTQNFPTQAAGNNSTKAATTAYADQAATNMGAIRQPLDALLTSLSDLSSSISGALVYVSGVAETFTVDTDGTLAANSDIRFATQKAVKTAIEATVQGLNPKHSVRAATTINITLSGAQTIDDVAVVAGDRVLVKNQSTASQNGIYVAAAGSWSRSFDADVWSELPAAFVFVEEGTDAHDTGWTCTVNAGGTLGSTAVTWVQFSSAGIAVAGNGLSKSGNTFSIDTAITVDKTTAQALTSKDLTSGTNTFPTLNQNTTGSAASLTTARTIDGQSFDGTANITVIAPATHAATSKVTPADTDEIPLVDSAASNVLKRLLWSNIKNALKTYFDPLYAALGGAVFTGAIQTTTIEVGAATDTTLARSSAGNLSVEGNLLYRAGGTDVPVTDGGTGASDAATARTNLGAIGGSTGATDNRLLRADGTGAATAQNSAITVDDSGNITGAGTFNGVTLDTSAWTAYSPTPTATVGSFTTVSGSGRYKIVGKIMFLQCLVTITNAGTAGGTLQFPLPSGAAAALSPINAFEGSTVKQMSAYVASSTVSATLYDGSTVIASGRTCYFNGSFELT